MFKYKTQISKQTRKQEELLDEKFIFRSYFWVAQIPPGIWADLYVLLLIIRRRFPSLALRFLVSS